MLELIRRHLMKYGEKCVNKGGERLNKRLKFNLIGIKLINTKACFAISIAITWRFTNWHKKQLSGAVFFSFKILI